MKKILLTSFIVALGLLGGKAVKMTIAQQAEEEKYFRTNR